METVARIVAQLVEFHRRQYQHLWRNQLLTITWHGGEPLLAGIDFYREIVKIQDRYPGIQFENRMQTNGTLLTEPFARLLARHDFNIGFSLDGPESMNNTHRHYRGKTGNPFTDARKGLELYRRYANPERVPVIAVITKETIKRVDEFFHFFKGLNAKVQLDIYDICTSELLDSSSTAAGLSVHAPDAADIGNFLIRLFDLWFYDPTRQAEFSDLRDEVKMILQPELNCGEPFFKKRCAPGRLIFDPQGKAFSCDQYINDDRNVLGDISQDSLADILERKFLLWDEIKHHIRGSTDQMACDSCSWGQQCAGGCITCMKYNALLLQARKNNLPVNRWYDTELPDKLRILSGETYYCDGLRLFREHIKAVITRELNHA